MADSGRLTTLLEQYRDRLHSRGEEEHDEDIAYLMQVLQSPLMKEYLLGDSPVSEATLIQEMTTALENQEHDVHLSPNSKRRRNLARKASIRALKLALTPHTSPRIQRANEKRQQRVGSPEYPLVQQVMAKSYSNRSGSHESSPSPMVAYSNGDGLNDPVTSPRWPREGFESHNPHLNFHNAAQVTSPASDQVVPQDPAYSIDHIYISPYTGKHEYPGIESSTSPVEQEEKDPRDMVSHSTDTLIEHEISPYLVTERDNGMVSVSGSERYSEFIRKGLNSEDIRTPDMGDSQDEETLQGFQKLMGPPTSFVPRDQQTVTPPVPPVLPSYTEALTCSSQQRVKSYEDLLSDKMDHMKISPTPAITPPGAPPPYYYPRGGPTTAGLPTQNVTTDRPRGFQHQLLTISLFKGPQGLGLSINRKKNTQKGEIGIFVQDIQPGGVAEREGICKGDFLVSINNQNLSGIGLPTAVALLQQAKGNIEIVLLRQQGGASVGMETVLSPTSLPRIPTQISMATPISNIHPSSPKLKGPSPVAMPTNVLPTSPKIKDPAILHPLPPPSLPQVNHHVTLSQHPSPVSLPTPSPPITPPSKLNEQSKKQKLVTVELPNEGRDLGFSLLPDDKGSIRINAILPRGTAERDGRLQPGDQLVAINGQSVVRLEPGAVVKVLKESRSMGPTLKLVVARAVTEMANKKEGEEEEEEEVEDEIASDSDSCSDYEDHDVELVKPVGQGLGITINALVNDEKGEDRGIYIGSVNPSGPAGQTGKVFPKDRIIKVNQHPLKSLTNMEAAAVLRNCGQTVHLVLRRQVKHKRPFEVTVLEEGPGISTTDRGKAPRKYSHTGQDEVSSSRGELRKGEGPIGDPDGREKLDENGEDNLLKERWRARIPINKTIKITRINRPDNSVSLGFIMESVILSDDTGQPGTGSIRHVIQSIHEGSPANQNGVLMVGDEILEVNGKPLVGVTHDEATELVQSTSRDVTIVVCRPREEDNKERTSPPAGEVPLNSDSNPFITTTSESEDDHRSSSTLTSSSSPALHPIYQTCTSTIPGFARRFERQSWRERHAELTRKLKERLEIKQEQYSRNLKERLDEVEKEMEERNQRIKEAEEKQNSDFEEKRSSLQSGLDYTSYSSPIGYYSSSVNEMGVAEESLPNGHRDSMASEDGSAEVLSPVPGSGLWENEVVEVELPRGDEGLGFSILDFSDPVSPGDRVILVYSLVTGGTAEIDGRLQKGDKLVSVNGVSVVNHSLEFTVEKLKSTSEDGLVHICVNHSVPDTPEIDSTPSSFSPDNLAQFLPGSVSEEADEEEEYDENSEQEQEKRKTRKEQLQQRMAADNHASKEGTAHGLEQTKNQSSRLKRTSDSDVDKPLNEDPLIAGWEDKGPLNEEEEEEPLPQYAEPSPLDSKKERENSGGRERRKSNQGDGRSVTPATMSSSVPSSQHPLFSRTRSDEPALHGYSGPLGWYGDSLRLMESTSEETLVASSSHQDLHFSSNQPSPKQHPSPQMRGRSVVTNSNLSSQEYNRNTSQPTFSPSRSQEDPALQEGLSPDMSEAGDHSAEAESEPRSIEILKGANPLGMSLVEDKGHILVKKIDSSSVLGHDGRIRAGDRILSINDKSLEGLAISKVRSILKRASSNRNTKVKITYIPASFTVPVAAVDSNTQNRIPGSSSHTQYTQSHPLTQQPYPMRQMQPHPMIHSHMGHNLSSMVPSHQTYQWMQGQHMGYNPAAPIQTRPQVNLQAPYLEQPIPIKPPPPPYPVYQSTLMNPGSHYQQQPVNWGNIPGMDFQPQPSWNIGLQNQMQYGGEYLPSSQYTTPPAGGGVMGSSQQMSKPQAGTRGNPMHEMTQPTYQTDQLHQYIHYPQGRMGIRTGNYDVKQVGNESNKASWSGRKYPESYANNRSGNYLEPRGPPRIVELQRDRKGTLGISLGLPEDGIEGVVIIGLSKSCNAMNKGTLLLGDRILEVNGHNLRRATQHEAVSIIKHSRDPVKMLIQSYTGSGIKKRFQNSPLHSNDGSWAIDEEEDERLRQLFPNANGYLFEVILNKGNGGLGLSIWKTEQTQNVLIMQVKPGSLADKAGKIKVGDELLQVNNCCVIGWRHEDVSQLLKQSPPQVRMILIRPLPILPPNSVPTSAASMQNLRQKLHVLQEQQQQLETENNSMQKEADGRSNTNNINPPVDMSGLPLVKAITIQRDDEIGFGFTVSELKTKAEPVVVVSDIMFNGPAQQEGQLAVGDNIISIDGHKVIGAKYEKATHLLQQARSRGYVTLIVSSKTQLPSQLTDKIESTPHKRRDMGEKRKRVRSEGVTLRNRMTKKPQIKSKRRPVSVDCEMNFDVSDINRVNSQSSKGDGSSIGSHSNRNSRILSENEMRQGMEHFTSSALDQEIKPGKPCTIEVFRGKEPLGISILDRTDSYQEGLFIQKVHPNTPAALDGRLKPGDRILRIGNTSVERATKDEAFTMIMETQSVVQLTVYRAGHHQQHQQHQQGEEQTNRLTGAISSGRNIEIVELMKPEQRGVGLMIIGDETSGGVLVSDVVEGEAAAFTNRIRKGDKILAINGEDISSADRDTAITLLQNCRGKVTLKVQHLGEDALRRNLSMNSSVDLSSSANYTSSHRQDYKSPTRGVSRLPQFYHSPSPPSAGVKPHPHDPPPYMLPTEHSVPRGSRGTTPLRSDPSFGEEDTYPTPSLQHQSMMPSTAQYRDVVGQSIPDGSTHNVPQTLGDIPPPIMRRDARNVRVVHLQRGPAGLGFSIVGGKGSPKGDLPICVRTVSPNSIAGKEGLLKPGDIIIAVNGIAFDNLTHQEAVGTLKRCNDSIMLTICTP